MTTDRYDDFLRRALEEDLGERGDLTSAATIPEGAVARARLIAREAGVISGLDVALRVFQLLDAEVRLHPRVEEGAEVEEDTTLAEVEGSARSLLAAERLVLNLLAMLSGVATETRRFVREVEGTGARIMDTRKTVPGMRALQKRAVVAGGGVNHRMGLHDAVLVKDNHLAAVGSVDEAVRRARDHVGDSVPVEVEVESSGAVEEAIGAGADVVLLDNMTPEEMLRAVEIADGRCQLEASGGILLVTVRAVAETGVDRISVGRLTHSAPALDVAMDFGAPPAP